MLGYVSKTETEEGEESIFGSSTRIHFQGCNMRCAFCINKSISRPPYARGAIGSKEIIEEVKKIGPVNSIHLITPSHIILDELLPLIEALEPYGTIVYNTSGYDSPVDIQALIAGEYIDVFLITFKFFSNDVAFKYCGGSNYASVVKKNLTTISKHYQLEFKQSGYIKRGLVIRHLLMPNDLGESNKVFQFAASLPNEVYFNLMDQYIPYKIPKRFKELKTPPTYEQYMVSVNNALTAGLDVKKSDRVRKCLTSEGQ